MNMQDLMHSEHLEYVQAQEDTVNQSPPAGSGERRKMISLVCSATSQNYEVRQSYDELQKRMSGSPVLLPKSFNGFLTSPQESLPFDGIGYSGVLELIPISHKVLFNETLGVTELVVSLSPLFCRRSELYQIADYDEDFTPYFVPMYEPWLTSSTRSFSMSIVSSLLTDVPRISFDVSITDDPSVTRFYNPYVKTFE